MSLVLPPFAFMKRSQGRPVIIDTSNTLIGLERIELGKGTHSEKWLQKLIHQHPDLLPIAEIEPGFGEPVAVAMEVPCGHGYIDNVFVTPTGDIIVIETKLWSNVEARREVVAQALDYVAALIGTDYAAFEAMLRRGEQFGNGSLYGLVDAYADALTEAAFVDAISNNLARGRMIVMVLGDGIRSEAEALGRLLQSHAGAHFTFAMVEVGIWRDANNGMLLAVPNTLAQTVMIERGIVRVENGVAKVSEALQLATSSAKAQSITSEIFDEALAKRGAALPKLLHDFAASLEPMGVYVELMASMNLKVEVGASKPLNLGYIQKTGKVWISGSGLNAISKTLGLGYVNHMAGLIGGSVATGNDQYVVAKKGTGAPFLEAFLPDCTDSWRAAIARLIDAARAEVTGIGE